MLGLGNSLLRWSVTPGGEPYSSAITNKWLMDESGLVTPPVLADLIGGNNITPTLGQALDFDGAADGIYTDDDLMDFMHGQTASCYYAIFKQTSGTAATDGIIFAGGRTTVNMCVRQYTPGTKKLRVYTRTAAGTLIHDTGSNAYTEGHWVGMILTINLKSGTGQFYFKDYTSAGSWSAATTSRGDGLGAVNTTVSLETTTGWRRFSVGSGFTNTTPAYYMDGTIYRAGIGAFVDYTKAVTLLDGGTIADRHILVTLDDGASLTTSAVTGTETCTAITAAGAPSWTNGAHEPDIPQKGLGGGNYTGGIGATVLHTFDVTGDADPGSGISANEFNALGTDFTFDGWVYKPNAAAVANSDFWSTLDASTGITRRGVRFRTAATTTSGVFTAYGDTAEVAATVAMNASGWWYFACVLRSGVPELYLAQPADSSLASNIGASAAGDCTVSGTAGVNNLYIMARYHDTPGTTSNCEAGTRIDGMNYFAGVALTAAQVLKRFKFSKSRYL